METLDRTRTRAACRRQCHLPPAGPRGWRHAAVSKPRKPGARELRCGVAGAHSPAAMPRWQLLKPEAPLAPRPALPDRVPTARGPGLPSAAARKGPAARSPGPVCVCVCGGGRPAIRARGPNPDPGSPGPLRRSWRLLVGRRWAHERAGPPPGAALGRGTQHLC